MSVLKFSQSIELYEVDIFCSNCSGMFRIKVEKGRLVKEAEKEKKCPKCGCTQKQMDEWMKNNHVGIPRPV